MRLLLGNVPEFAAHPLAAFRAYGSHGLIRERDASRPSPPGIAPCLVRSWLDPTVRSFTLTQQVAFAGKRPARNDACPCGSGKKFKRCCLPASAFSSIAQAVRPREIPPTASPIPPNVLLSTLKSLQGIRSDAGALALTAAGRNGHT